LHAFAADVMQTSSSFKLDQCIPPERRYEESRHAEENDPEDADELDDEDQPAEADEQEEQELL